MSASQKFNMEDVCKKLQEFSANKFWAESSAAVTSTLLQSWETRNRENFKMHKLEFRKSKRANLLFKLAIMSWFVNEETGFVVREAIHPLVQSDFNLIHIKVSLISKRMMLKVLEDELSGLHPNQVFGNFLNKDEWSEVFFRQQVKFEIIEQVNPLNDSRPLAPKRTIGVGYSDKGTLPESWKPKTEAFQDNALHNKLMKRREAYQYLEGEYIEYLCS